MDTNVYINWLLDFYGAMLTKRQRDVMEFHFSDDLSLSEIASTLNISRQAVHDSLKRGQKQLEMYEEKLNLLKRYFSIKDKLDEVSLCVEKLEKDDEKKYCVLEKKIEELLNIWEN